MKRIVPNIFASIYAKIVIMGYNCSWLNLKQSFSLGLSQNIPPSQKGCYKPDEHEKRPFPVLLREWLWT